MALPAPYASPVYQELQRVAALIADHFAPRGGAYHEIWLNGKILPHLPRHDPADPEPLYGKLYVPRNFKTGLALPEDNSIEIFTQDLSLQAIVVLGRVDDYIVIVGGDMGCTHASVYTLLKCTQH